MYRNRSVIVEMIVGNGEGDRYLDKVLKETVTWADKVVILLDNTDVKTEVVCRKYTQLVFKHEFAGSVFKENEAKLRNLLWEHVRKIAVPGDFIVALDSDEIINKKEFIASIYKALDNNKETITYRLLDLWEERDGKLYYRIDGYWSPLMTRAFIYKNQPFNIEGEIHCGSLPRYTYALSNQLCAESRIQHYGWLSDDDKHKKVEFYNKKSVIGDINYQHINTAFSKNKNLTEFKLTDYADRHKILIASLIRDRDWCLDDLLKNLEKQSEHYNKDNISWYFILNNSVDKSEQILVDFYNNYKDKYGNRIYIDNITMKTTDDKDHNWTDIKLANMAYMRNMVLKKTQDLGMDYLFMVDSDIILRDSDTIRHLATLERDVVAENHWATWGMGGMSAPSVWQRGGYDSSVEFIEQLRKPGVYEVGGFCACTLFSRYSFDVGVNYSRVNFLPANIRGEDRDFCCRASVLGIKLYADTYKEPIHLETDHLQKNKKNLSVKDKNYFANHESLQG